MFSHCLLASLIFMRNKLFILLKTAYTWWVAILLLLLLTLAFDSVTITCLQHESLWVHLTWNWWSFLDVYIHIFHQIWKVLQHSSDNSALFSLSSFWDSHDAYLMLSHRFLKLHSLFFHLFSFCSSDFIISIVLSSSSLILSTCSNLPLNPLMNFSFHSLYLLAPEFLFCFFLGFLSHYWYFCFVHTLFSWLSPHLPLSIFKTVVVRVFW